jgi:hypothetical protein
LPFLEKHDWWEGSPTQLWTFRQVAPLVQERVSLLIEAPEMVAFLYRPVEISSDLVESVLRKDARSAQILKEIGEIYANLPEFNHDSLNEATRAYCETIGTPLRKVQVPFGWHLLDRRSAHPCSSPLNYWERMSLCRGWRLLVRS